MRKFDLNKKYLEICLYVLFVVAVSIILEKLIGNISGFSRTIWGWLNFLKRVLSPFIYGFFIAYFMNASVNFFEYKLLSRINYNRKYDNVRRIVAILCTYAIFGTVLVFIISYLVPQVILSVTNLVSRIPLDPRYYETAILNYLAQDTPFANFLYNVNSALVENYTVADLVNRVFEPLLGQITSLTGFMNGFLATLLTGTFNVAYALLNFSLGLFIAFYMLCDKELFVDLLKKLVTIIFNRSVTRQVLGIAAETNDIVQKFIIGKGIDSIIIGIIFFCVCVIMKVPYPLLMAVIIGITNMIPYFGPFIGAVPVIGIVLMTNPLQALWTALAILVLQQFDGIYLGPKIIGDTTGLRPIMVVFAIIVGGAVGGIWGMFFGVPVFAALRTLVMGFVNKKFDEKASGVKTNGK